MVRLAQVFAPLSVVSVLATGCVSLEPPNHGVFDDFESEPTWVDSMGFYETDVHVGTMRGAMPVTGAFDRDVSSGHVSFGWSELGFESHATQEDWAMLAGGIDASVLSPGVEMVLDDSNQWVFGCSGPAEFRLAYDEPASTVQVRLDEVLVDGDRSLSIQLRAWFDGGWEAETVMVVPDPRVAD